jgi:hypothetical protein
VDLNSPFLTLFWVLFNGEFIARLSDSYNLFSYIFFLFGKEDPEVDTFLCIRWNFLHSGTTDPS